MRQDLGVIHEASLAESEGRLYRAYHLLESVSGKAFDAHKMETSGVAARAMQQAVNRQALLLRQSIRAQAVSELNSWLVRLSDPGSMSVVDMSLV